MCTKKQRNLCFSEDCCICFNRSFASNPKVDCWDKERNKCTARNISKYTSKKFWFKMR